jgi:hypothetical protein
VSAQPAVRRHLSFGAGVVAVLLGAAILLVGPSAAPAHACSCSAASDEQYFAGAEAVFRGQLVSYTPPPPPVMSSADPAVWTFAVSEVYKGVVAPTQPVVSAVSGATCGLEIPHQGEFFVFASRRDIMGNPTPGQYHASLCGGTRSTSAGPLAVAALQPPTTTVATTTPPPPTTQARPATTVTTVASVVISEPAAPTTMVAAAPAPPGSLEQQSLSGDPEAAMVPTSEDEAGGIPVGLVVVVAAVALFGLGGVGVYRRQRRPAGSR